MFSTVVSMLAIRPNERRRASDIYNELLPHENQILDLEEFVMERVNYPPQQIRPVSQQYAPGAHQYFEPNRQTQPAPVFHFSGQPQQVRR